MQENESAAGDRTVRPEVAGLPWALAVVFFALVPLVVGLNQGWLQAGLGRYFPRPQSMLLWCGNWLLYWWVCELMTRIAAAVLRPWRLRPLAPLLLGAILATIFSPLYFGAYSMLFLAYMPPSARVYEAEDLSRIFEVGFLLRLLASGSGGILLWTLSNFFIDTYLRGTRFHALGIAKSASLREIFGGNATAPLPAFATSAGFAAPAVFMRLTKLPIPTPETLIAIEAQEHYLKVHSDFGCELIYYRFGDAVRELQNWRGLQVHRSYWIARSAITHVENHERRVRLVMRNALLVPVGSSFIALVRQAGLTTVGAAGNRAAT